MAIRTSLELALWVWEYAVHCHNFDRIWLTSKIMKLRFKPYGMLRCIGGDRRVEISFRLHLQDAVGPWKLWHFEHSKYRQLPDDTSCPLRRPESWTAPSQEPPISPETVCCSAVTLVYQLRGHNTHRGYGWLGRYPYPQFILRKNLGQQSTHWLEIRTVLSGSPREPTMT